MDSCLHPESGRPATLGYLASLGLDPDVVQIIVVTHWHDAHIAGIATAARECGAARIACSQALRREDLVQFVYEQEGAGGAFGSGLDELRTILDIAEDRGGVVWAKANLPLHPRPPGDRPLVTALSPSEDAVERSILRLIEAATGEHATLRRRFTAPDGPNGGSVATVMRSGDVTSLLGADVESTTQNLETGWGAIVSYARPPVRASLVKVPHRGSRGAHHDEMWEELLSDDVVAIVTPWNKGTKFLPAEEDLDRLSKFSERLYVTATPRLSRVEKDADVERLVRRLHGERVKELRGWGHVRARRVIGGEAWSVECDGDAILVASPRVPDPE